MANKRFNKQVPGYQDGGRAKKQMGGVMGPVARRDERAGYYPSDMGMAGGAMYKKGGTVKKKAKKSGKINK